MKFDAIKFGLAGGISTAIIWVICSALVALSPDMMWNMTEQMVHMDFQSLSHDMNWSLSMSGFVTGLIVWSVSVGVFLWLIAASYNYLTK